MERLFDAPFTMPTSERHQPFIFDLITQPVPTLTMPLPSWLRSVESKLPAMTDPEVVQSVLNPEDGFPCRKMPFKAFKEAYSFETFQDRERLFGVVLQLVDFESATDADVLELIFKMETIKEPVAQKYLAMVKDLLDKLPHSQPTVNKTHVFRMHTLVGSATEAVAQITAKTGAWTTVDVLTTATECTLTPLKTATLCALLGSVTFGTILNEMYRHKLSCGEFLRAYMEANLQMMDRDELFRLAVYITQCATKDYVSMAKMIETELEHPIEFDTFTELRHFYETDTQMKLMWHLTDIKTTSLSKIIQLCKEHKQFPQNYLVQSLNDRMQGKPEEANKSAVQEPTPKETLGKIDYVSMGQWEVVTVNDVAKAYPGSELSGTEMFCEDGGDFNRYTISLQGGKKLLMRGNDYPAIQRAIRDAPKPNAYLDQFEFTTCNDGSNSMFKRPKPSSVKAQSIHEHKRMFDMEQELPPPQANLVGDYKTNTFKDVVRAYPGCTQTRTLACFSGRDLNHTTLRTPEGVCIRDNDQEAIDKAIQDVKMFEAERQRIEAIKNATRQPSQTRVSRAAPTKTVRCVRSI